MESGWTCVGKGRVYGPGKWSQKQAASASDAAARHGTWNGIKHRGVSPPDNAFKPLIKRAPSARPHDAETGFVIARSARRRSLQPRRSARGHPETVIIAAASLERARACLHS